MENNELFLKIHDLKINALKELNLHEECKDLDKRLRSLNILVLREKEINEQLKKLIEQKTIYDEIKKCSVELIAKILKDGLFYDLPAL